MRCDLDYLAQRSRVIFDACALISPINQDSRTRRAKGLQEVSERDSADFFKRKIRTHGRRLMVTSSVSQEYLGGNGQDLAKRSQLIAAFRAGGREISFNGDRFSYNLLKGMYYPLKSSFRLGDVDYDLAISTAVLAISGQPIALVSNDQDLLRFMTTIIPDQIVRFPSARCYMRTKFDEFFRFYP